MPGAEATWTLPPAPVAQLLPSHCALARGRGRVWPWQRLREPPRPAGRLWPPRAGCAAPQRRREQIETRKAWLSTCGSRVGVAASRLAVALIRAAVAAAAGLRSLCWRCCRTWQVHSRRHGEPGNGEAHKLPQPLHATQQRTWPFPGAAWTSQHSAAPAATARWTSCVRRACQHQVGACGFVRWMVCLWLAHQSMCCWLGTRHWPGDADGGTKAWEPGPARSLRWLCLARFGCYLIGLRGMYTACSSGG